MTECQVTEQDSGFRYYTCEVMRSSDSTKVISMMFGLRTAISKCLDSSWVSDLDVIDWGTNDFWINFTRSSGSRSYDLLNLRVGKYSEWILDIDINARGAKTL